MELIDKLEEGFLALTTEIKALREENAKLKEEVGNSQGFLEQCYALEEQLNGEKEARIKVQDRLEVLLEKISQQLAS